MAPRSFTPDGFRGDDPALDALFSPFESGELTLTSNNDVLFLRARAGSWMHRHDVRDWRAVQSFKPAADALERHVTRIDAAAADDRRHALVLLLPPRQRDEARALFAQALDHVADDGIIVASIANNEGARSGQDDLERLAGPLRQLSKHKCRVFWTLAGNRIDNQLHTQWRALDDVQVIGDGWLSRPGLFAWNRIDAASALLAAQLPDNLRGTAADLGAGFGYLSAELLRRCAGITAIDLYEAEARALEPARRNLDRVAMESDRDEAKIDVIWHDVATGLPKRYDVIVSNPPFHQGRADLPGLGQRFIDVAADALHRDGQLWLVANRHLPYETTLSARFTDVRTVALEDGYKVFHATGVRP